MKPYVIWSPPYHECSGGIRVLHRLCHELTKRDIETYITTEVLCDDLLETSYRDDSDDFIAVYPEIVAGNPLGAKTVARWVLNVPGRLAGETEYDKDEIIFPFSRILNQWGLPEERVLYLPELNLDFYYDKNDRPRHNKVAYFGKGKGAVDKDTIVLGNKPTVERADLLRSSYVMYCFDNMTAMMNVSRLCGCPVVLIPNGELTEEQLNMWETGRDGIAYGKEQYLRTTNFHSGDYRLKYKEEIKKFDEKLENFIKETQ